MIYYDHNYQNQSDTTSISPFFLRAIWLKNLWRLTFWFDLMTATGFGRKLGPAWRHLPLSGLFKVLLAHYPLTRIMAAWRVISLMISAWSLVSHIPCSPIPPVFLVIFFGTWTRTWTHFCCWLFWVQRWGTKSLHPAVAWVSWPRHRSSRSLA